MQVTALAGEPLDALIWRMLGRASPSVEQVLAATPGLSTIAAALPEGHQVTLPDLDPGPPEIALVQLWD